MVAFPFTRAAMMAAITLLGPVPVVPGPDQDEPARVRSGVLTDPVGDVRAGNGMPVPPDIVRAQIDVQDGVLTLTVTFAPGTLSPRTSLNIYLDTDESASTGAPRTLAGLGADYEISPRSPHVPLGGALSRHASATDSKFAGVLTWTQPAPDQRQVQLPLSRLGNDDGRMTFALECNYVLEVTNAGQTSTQTIASHVDVVPDRGRPLGTVR